MTEVGLYTLGVLFVALGIGISIALHEVGHLVPAKIFGVRVTQYMVGFGPTIWSRQRGETEFGLKAIPLGGFIRMIGMFPPRKGDAPGMIRASSTGRFSQLMDEARTVSMEEVRPGDEERVFYRLSTPKKVIIMLGGPVMNLVIATVLLGGIITIHGVPEPTSGAQIISVSECVVPAAEAATKTACAAGDPRTPAYQAGLLPGDKVLAIDGTKLGRNTDLSAAVRPASGRDLAFLVERDGSRLTLTVRPVQNTVARYGADGEAILDEDGQPVTMTAGFVGITSSTPTVLTRQSVTAVPAVVGSGIEQTASVLLRIPQKMVGVAQAAFGSGARDPEGPISVVGVGRIAGEVTSGKVDFLGNDAGSKIVLLLSLMASLNLALFVFNLIPLLPLDGGHVAGALWEGLKRSTARVLKRPDPGHVDVAKALPLAYAVSMALIVMSVLLIYADLVNPVRLG